MPETSFSLAGKCVVLGVTGGIAAYKACELTSRLRKAGAQVYVIMTKNACQFVAPLTFETLSNHPVATDTFARPETWEVEHVALAKRADVFVIAPATANILAKMACGLADDMLSTTVLATRAPVLVAPAMNTGMWDNPATQENVERLQQRGVHFIGPEGGFEEAEVELAKEAGFQAITLGRRILRTETAGMTVLSILMYQLEEN